MKQSLAYHGVVNAMEAKSGWTPMSRFAAAVTHAIHGHLPYHRYHAAGLARAIDGAREGTIERLIVDFLDTDLNPAVTFFTTFRHPLGVVAGFNAYNDSAQLGVRTSVHAADARSPQGGHAGAKRSMLAKVDDPELCRVGTLVAFDSVLGKVRGEIASGAPHRAPTLASVAAHLGVQHTAAAEVAMVFELEGHASVGEVAARLGCHRRTMERRLRELGTTAEALRQAARMIRSTARLSSLDSLTTIAMEEGFSDLAHMTRAFQASCGMPPSLMRKLLWAEPGIIRP